MKRLCLLLQLGSAGPAQSCDLDPLTAALAAPLEQRQALEFEVAVPQMTEGGVWRIYRDNTKNVTDILRLDGGESGRIETRLSFAGPRLYGISRTRFDYIRHAFLEGPFAIARVETHFYYFCGGKPYAPPQDSTMLDNPVHVKEAEAARAGFLRAKEIAAYVGGLR